MLLPTVNLLENKFAAAPQHSEYNQQKSDRDVKHRSWSAWMVEKSGRILSTKAKVDQVASDD